MAVYVDSLFPTRPTRKWPFNASCHMIADTQQELHEMARKIGLKREWYQCRQLLPHYDLTANKRKKALALGAIAVSFKEVNKLMKAKRALLGSSAEQKQEDLPMEDTNATA